MAQLLYIVSGLHMVLCPYTKVEESFNMQAFHDILYYRHNLSLYDHNEFPGVVPRTFIGPLVISLLSAPLVTLFEVFGVSKFWTQYVVRLSLALCVIGAWSRLRSVVQKHFGSAFAWWFTMLTVSQYHFMFYMSRPLPNIMVMPLVLLAYAGWLQGKQKQFLLSAGAAIVIFRAELALLFGMLLLYDLCLGRITFVSLAKLVIPAGICLVALTVAIDSVFWGRLVWPEAEVFWFNTIMNKSSEWGTSPFSWYWYSALPRGLGPSLALVPIGLYLDKRMWTFAVPAFVYVMLFSLLPHKELRFIIYVFPLLNMVSAGACSYIFTRRTKAPIYELLFLGVVVCIVGNITLSGAFISVATTNYPGGVAISRFHKLLKDEPFVHVHISNLAAQTGVTRFTQLNSHWQYSKNESLQPEHLQQYTHLLIEAKSKYSPNLKPFANTHKVLDAIESFSQIVVSYKSLPPVKIRTKPAIFILERKNFREFPIIYDYAEETTTVEPQATETIESIDKAVAIDDSIESTTEVSESDEEYASETEIEEMAPKLEPKTEVIEEIFINEPVILKPIEEILPEIKTENSIDTTITTDANAEQAEFEEAQKVFEDMKAIRRERKQRAIKKIKSETRKEVVASAKEKLKEIMNKHKNMVADVSEHSSLYEELESSIKDEVLPANPKESEENTEFIGQSEELIESDDKVEVSEPKLGSKTENVDSIVEEVITRLIDRKIYDDKTKPEDISIEDRQIIQKIVEEVVAERLNITNTVST